MAIVALGYLLIAREVKSSYHKLSYFLKSASPSRTFLFPEILIRRLIYELGQNFAS
jgi:hypothetical protein